MYRPKSLEDALEFLDKHSGEAKPLAGGTELIILIRDRRIPIPKHLVDLNAIKRELSFVEKKDDGIHIGGGTTLYELSQTFLHKDKRFAGFVDVYKKFGTLALRFEATIAGNLVSATQYNDYITLLLVYDAKLRLVSANGERIVRLEDFLIDKRKVDLKPNELIYEIIFSEPPMNSSSSFIKFDRRELLIAGVVTGAAFLALEDNKIADVKISFDMVREKRIPGRARKSEEFLKGKEFSEEILEKVAEEVLPTEMERVTDWWTNAEYRMDMSKVVLKRNLLRAYKRIKG
ncbi:FAD binding domain-containing protein [Staphylothermus hellenicus]|uniref:FAD binding domain-containing protein n=1 Tax=Staphylothermus hellenicus TaxID=84599 RepID=UPI0011E56EC8|nr:FAD binding domain-containing protein [Staphylothermus hellenicus]